MSGNLILLDVTRANPICADYLGGIPAEQNSAVGVVWVKNNGSSQVSNISVSINNVLGGDGSDMLKFAEVSPILPPANPPAAVKQLGTGAVVGPITLYYKYAALGIADGPSLPSPEIAVEFLAGEVGHVELSWDAVANALGYAVYISSDNINYFLLVKTIASLSAVDSAGLNGAVSDEKPVTLNQAFRETGSFVAGPLSLGDLDPGDMLPVGYRAEIPAGVSPAGNTRMADIYVEGSTV